MGNASLSTQSLLQYYLFREACPCPTTPVHTFIMAPITGREGGRLHYCLPRESGSSFRAVTRTYLPGKLREPNKCLAGESMNEHMLRYYFLD